MHNAAVQNQNLENIFCGEIFHTKTMSMREWIAEENSIGAELMVFVLGGIMYGSLEIVYRGFTHWSMVVTGGACVLTMYVLLEWLNSQPLVIASLAGAVIITAYEFTVGCIVNLRFGWNVWDYSHMAGNLLGQICPVFTGMWFLLCFLFLGMVRILPP